MEKTIGTFLMIIAVVAMIIIVRVLTRSNEYKNDILGILLDGWEVFELILAVFGVGFVYFWLG